MKKPLWTLEEAQKMCRYLESKLIQDEQLCHVALGGSVLHQGQSDKDVDVFIYPHDIKRWHPTADRIWEYLLTLGFRHKREDDSAPSTGDKDVRILYTPKGDKRVDFFFLGFTKQHKPLEDDVPF